MGTCWLFISIAQAKNYLSENPDTHYLYIFIQSLKWFPFSEAWMHVLITGNQKQYLCSYKLWLQSLSLHQCQKQLSESTTNSWIVVSRWKSKLCWISEQLKIKTTTTMLSFGNTKLIWIYNSGFLVSAPSPHIDPHGNCTIRCYSPHDTTKQLWLWRNSLASF